MTRYIAHFSELQPQDLPRAGGKGANLALLYQQGLPIPEGFIILPSAFNSGDLCEDARLQVLAALQKMQKVKAQRSFAVRSSAIGEDSTHASFAGGFTSVLDLKDSEEVLRGVQEVQASLYGERALSYTRAQGLSQLPEMAVVIQELVKAEYSGVLFTRDPLNNTTRGMVGNVARGLGEALVSGEANAEAFTIDRDTSLYSGPAYLRVHATALRSLALDMESILKAPQDIEWAVSSEKVYILQSRPITTLEATDPVMGQWNDTLMHNYLWSAGNAGEFMPEVITPLSYSLQQVFNVKTSPIRLQELGPMAGNIGGRMYFNFTLMYSLSALGKPHEEALVATECLLGKLPAGVKVTKAPIPRAVLLRAVVDNIRWSFRYRSLMKNLPNFLTTNPAWYHAGLAKINQCKTREDLLHFWTGEALPQFIYACWMLRAASKGYFDNAPALARKIQALVGEEDAATLMSNLNGQSTGADLASLGPVVGLWQLSQGRISKDDYRRLYGHRGPNEVEVAEPRHAEDPEWPEREVALMVKSNVDVEASLKQQILAREVVINLLKEKHPQEASKIIERLDQLGLAARQREAVRSELVRLLGIVRTFALKAGEITGLGSDIFYLAHEEITEVLSGQTQTLALVTGRKAKYRTFRALPPYPPFVEGKFDPVEWAQQSLVREASSTEGSEAVFTGHPGSLGYVEGVVRVIESYDDSEKLQPGEILVTRTTNVAWTLLFPRCKAVITDIGAPLSHSAIVARELGIPAVVGCIDATSRLKTGDRVIVNGGKGEVRVIS